MTDGASNTLLFGEGLGQTFNGVAWSWIGLGALGTEWGFWAQHKAGWAHFGSHHLVVGGAVNGGDVYGTLPTFALSGPDDANDRGVWIPGFGIDQYGATLASWYGLSGSQLGTVFANLSQFGSANLGFMGA